MRRTAPGAYIFSRQGFIAVVEVMLVMVCAYQASKLFWVFATPSAVGESSPSAISITTAARPYVVPQQLTVTSVNLFRATQQAAATTATAAPATTLNLELFGVRTGAQGRSSAIIRRPNGTQDVFAPGQQIIEGVTLEEIRADRVVIRRLGTLESLYLDTASALSEGAVGGPPTLTTQTTPPVPDANSPRRFFPAETKELFAAIEIAPGRAASGRAGLSIRPRGDGALFRDAGFEAGDVLLSVNGQPVTAVAPAAAIFKEIGTAQSFTVTFDRAGQTLTQRLVVDR